VDDEPYVRDVLAEYLRARGLEVAEASNGLEALLRFKHARPDAIVLDILMPRLGGLRTLRRIRALDSSITVVVVTGTADADLRRQMEGYGVAAILAKPVKLDDLWSALGVAETEDPGRPLPQPPRASSPPAATAEPASAGRILVVDDEPEICSMLVDFLTKAGYRARSVPDGLIALESMREDEPDVVLLDIAMPRLSGIDALTAIHETARHVKVVMISGTDDFEVARAALAHGAFDFVAKPLDFKYLAQIVQSAILMKLIESEWPGEDRDEA
jgi:CheY-like chemotaxis protein